MSDRLAAARVFIVHCQCSNCLRPSSKRVPIPAVEGAPGSVDEFIEMLEHAPVPFACRHCESIIGELVGVTIEAESVAA